MSIFKSVLGLLVYKVFIFALKVKFDLGGQRSFGKKVAHLIYEVGRKSFIKISRTVLYLYAFEIYILASEVKVGLGGQRS